MGERRRTLLLHGRNRTWENSRNGRKLLTSFALLEETFFFCFPFFARVKTSFPLLIYFTMEGGDVFLSPLAVSGSPVGLGGEQIGSATRDSRLSTREKNSSMEKPEHGISYDSIPCRRFLLENLNYEEDIYWHVNSRSHDCQVTKNCFPIASKYSWVWLWQ
jgi:hypothetical protein